jgi:hypothetical protein
MSWRLIESVQTLLASCARTARRLWDDRRPRGRAGQAGRRFVPCVEALEDRTVPTAFTMLSPTTGGELPPGVTAIGGVVLDLIGVNGARVVSELPASTLFRGTFDNGSPEAFRGNPGTIGVQTGFTSAVLNSLGGGLAEVAVRLTVFDGDSAPGNFDFRQNELLLNGLTLGNFSDVATQETDADGDKVLSNNPAGGFRNDRLDTGFFHSADPAFLAAFATSLGLKGGVVYQLEDATPFDNFFDFTEGPSGGLLDVEPPPGVANSPRILSVTNDGPVIRGREVTVVVAATNPDGAGRPLTFEFDFGDEGTFEITNHTGIAQHTFTSVGSFVVNVRVTDADGAQAKASTTVEVGTVPSGFAENAAAPIEGAPATATTPKETLSPAAAGNTDAPLLIALLASERSIHVPGAPPEAAAGPPAVPLVPGAGPPSQRSGLPFPVFLSASGGEGDSATKGDVLPTPDLFGSAARLSARTADLVASVAWSGYSLAVAAFQVLDRALLALQALAARAPPSTSGSSPGPPPAVVRGLPPDQPEPVPASAISASNGRTGAAVTTTVLVLAALVLQRRPAGSWTLARGLRRRRRGKKPEAPRQRNA